MEINQRLRSLIFSGSDKDTPYPSSQHWETGRPMSAVGSVEKLLCLVSSTIDTLVNRRPQCFKLLKRAEKAEKGPTIEF